MARIQSVYELYQTKGLPGQCSRPNSPHFYQTAKLGGSVKGRPGYGVHWDAADNNFQFPASAADELAVIGVASYDKGAIQKSLSSIPTGANSDQYIEYEANDVIRLGIMGFYWAVAGEAMEYGDLLYWDRTDLEWKKRGSIAGTAPDVATATDGAPTDAELKAGVQGGLTAAYNATPKITPMCASESGANGGLIEIWLSGAILK